MTLEQEISELLGQGGAADKFVRAVMEAMHATDDVVDEAASITRSQMLWVSALSTDFYRQNAQHLFPILMLSACDYIDSEDWKKATELWKREVADFLRSTGNNLVLATILLVAGADAMLGISKRIREAAYQAQHV